MQVLKYFNPLSKEFPDSVREFDLHLSFKEQLITIALTAIATLISLPLLGLGGLAAFRRLVEHYSFQQLHAGQMPNNSAGRTAQRTHDAAQNHLQSLSKEQFSEKGLNILLSGEVVERDREKCREILNTLYDRLGSPNILLTALRETSKGDRIEVLDLALKFGETIDSPQQFSKLIAFIKNIKRDRAGVIGRLLPFCRGISSVDGIEWIKKETDKIPVDELNEMQDACAHFLEAFSAASDRTNFLKVIHENIPYGSRAEFITLHSDLLQRVRSTALLPEILQHICEVAEGDIERMKQLIQTMNADDDGTSLALVLRCVADIPEQRRNELLDGIAGCLHGIEGESLAPIFQILKHISDLEAGERVSVVGFALAHIHDGMNPFERRLILSALVELDDDERSDVSDEQLQGMIASKKLLMSFFKVLSPEKRQEVLSEINLLPITQRGDILKSIGPMMPHIETADQLKDILIGLKMIAPEYRDDAIGGLISNGLPDRFDWRRFLTAAYLQEGVRDASKRYLVQWLQGETNEAIARNAAQRIFDNAQLFGVAGNHNLDDPLIALLFAILPLDNANFRSPQGLFQWLVMQDMKPTPQLNLPAQAIEGARVKINQPHFESLVRDRKVVTFAELSEEITFEKLESLFESFESRINALGRRERQRVQAEGVGSCLVVQGVANGETPSADAAWQNYELLKRTFLGSEYVRTVLSSRGEGNQVVPTGYLHAYAVVKFISEASEEIEADTGLSVQEGALLRAISSIQNCSTGKSEGFADYFSFLPLEYRSFGDTLSDAPKERAIRYLHGTVQAILSHFLTDLGPMAKEMIGRENDPQFVHTRSYLKNLIAKRVGLEWSIAFDMYVGCIDSNLKERSLEDVLRIFYRHFTPEHFVDELFNEIRRDMMQESEEIDHLKEEIENLQGQLEQIKKDSGIDDLKKEFNGLQNQKMAKMFGVRNAKNTLIDLEEQYGEAPSEELERRIQEAAAQVSLAEKENQDYLNQVEELKIRVNQLKEERGINQVEGQIKDRQSRLAEITEEIFNNDLYQQLLALFENDSGYVDDDEDYEANAIPPGSFEFIDDSYTKAVITKKGLVHALIRAGYLEDASVSVLGITLLNI